MPQIQYAFKKDDEYYTPAYAVEPILKQIPQGSTVWCPFDTEESNFVKCFKSHGCQVIATHIWNGRDFFEIEPPPCDFIISNPPYSKKDQVFERLYQIGKPFAMLVNLQGIFDSKKRFELFKNNRLEMLWLNPRVDYIKQGNVKTGVPFQSGYLCSGIFKEQINFCYLVKR